GRGEFGQTMRGGLVKMAGRACRTDVVNIFGDEREKEIARSPRQQELPPVQRLQTFRRDAANGDAQQRSRAKADEGTKLFMRPREPRAQCAARQRDGKRRKNLE